MTARPLTIFLSAAEASGDHHAARLIRALRKRLPDARFVGAVGPQMAAEGCEQVADLTAHASMAGGPFLKVPYYLRMVRRLQSAIREIRPDILVPVDSPALNWHLAKTARKCGIKVSYYIAPQVWAWAPWRIKKVRRLTSSVACILPFEEEYLRRRGVNARYVGHPLFDDLPARPDPLPDLSQAWADDAWQVALVAGSRPGEIRGHAPALLAIARSIVRRRPNSSCIFAVHNDRAASVVRSVCDLREDEENIKVVVGQTPEIFSRCHFGIVKSGTVTLEAAHMGMPMVIFYRTGRLLGMLHRFSSGKPWLMPIKQLSLVNILAGKQLVKELMPWHGNVARLNDHVVEAMGDLGYLHELRQSLLELVRPLSPGQAGTTAADNAAQLIIETMESK